LKTKKIINGGPNNVRGGWKKIEKLRNGEI